MKGMRLSKNVDMANGCCLLVKGTKPTKVQALSSSELRSLCSFALTKRLGGRENDYAESCGTNKLWQIVWALLVEKKRQHGGAGRYALDVVASGSFPVPVF